MVNLFSGYPNIKLATFRQISQTLEDDTSSQDYIHLKQDLTNFDDHLKNNCIIPAKSEEKDAFEIEEISSSDSAKNSGFFKSENENEAGWIDLRPVKLGFRGEKEDTETATPQLMTTHRGLLLSQREDTSLTTLKKPVFTTENDRTSASNLNLASNYPLKQYPILKKIINNNSNNEDSESTRVQIKEQSPKIAKSLLIETSIAASQVSVKSQRKRISDAFHSALTEKISSRLLKTLITLFYGITIAIIIIKITTKINLDTSTQNLKAKKDVLNSAQTRSYMLTFLEPSLRTILDLTQGRLTGADSGYYLPLPFYTQRTLDWIIELAALNNNLLSNTSALDQDARRILFNSDIGIFETYYFDVEQEFTTLNTFDATNWISEMTLGILQQMNVDATVVKPQIRLISRNCMNDILEKEASVSEIFLQSVRDQSDNVLLIVKTTQTIILCLVGSITIAFICFIIKLYYENKNKMHALLKLNNSDVRSLMANLNKFKAVLENKKELGEVVGILETSHQKDKGSLQDNKKKRETTKKPIDTNFCRRYILFGCKLGLFVVFIAGSVLLSSLNSKSFISDLSTKQDQMHYVNWIRTRGNVAMIACQNIFYLDGLQTIENIPTLEALDSLISQISSVINQLPKILSEGDPKYQSEVDNILFVDGCKELAVPGPILCNTIRGYGYQTSFIQLLSTFGEQISEMKQQYMSSIQSYEALRAIQLKHYILTGALNYVLTAQSTLLAQIINDSYEETLINGNARRKNTVVLTSVFIALIATILWKVVFKRLQNSNNYFRRLLMVFPPQLIMSNFQLKMIALEGSNGGFDFMRNN